MTSVDCKCWSCGEEWQTFTTDVSALRCALCGGSVLATVTIPASEALYLQGIEAGAKMLGKAIMEATRESGCIWTPETDADDWNEDANANITLKVGEMRIAAILAKGKDK